tara:strand:+ start:657 stop:830 length:174 start_codon:yes stop_codon:yes gene_type:complete
MTFDQIEKIIEKYAINCINKDNQPIKNKECDKMLLYLQQNMLPKSKNIMLQLREIKK